jgi:hypothetical protein
MLREFEIFTKPSAPSIAVKRGFCWPGFFLTFFWALFRRLWLPAVAILLATVAVGVSRSTVLIGNPVPYVLSGLVLHLFVGLRGNMWRSQKLERAGYGFVGLVPARSAAAALKAFSMGRAPASSGGRALSPFFSLPRWSQRVFAIAWLTWKAAFRFRLFLVIAGLLLITVAGLPILIKDDGTARGFTQILLTYTLSVITALLGLSTLWLSCGTLARDIEECQIQMVAAKPIARWQIWMGKWLGIMTLNAALLALSGSCVYGLLQWRATRLPPEEQAILRNEVLVARGSAKEASLDSEIEENTEKVFQENLKRNPELAELTDAQKVEARKQLKEQVKAMFQAVPPGTPRAWKIDLGLARHFLRDQPLQLRVKFNSAVKSPSGTFDALWQVGVPQRTELWRTEEPMSLAPDTFHEFTISSNLFDADGILTVVFYNPPSNPTLLFPLEDGMEVLYRESGFGLNFARGLGIIFCWMALLAAIGLTAASFLSFPVATFFSLGLLTMALSTGTLARVVSEGGILGVDSESGVAGHSVLDRVVVPFFDAALTVINLARDFSPIDSLSSGRSITWGQLGLAFSQIVLFLGGIIAVIGMFIFSRRELATAQGNQ